MGVFKEYKDDILKPTEQKVLQRLSQDDINNTSDINDQKNKRIKAINEEFELITYRFSLRAYQLL
jgi:hypothetical protein